MRQRKPSPHYYISHLRGIFDRRSRSGILQSVLLVFILILSVSVTAISQWPGFPFSILELYAISTGYQYGSSDAAKPVFDGASIPFLSLPVSTKDGAAGSPWMNVGTAREANFLENGQSFASDLPWSPDPATGYVKICKQLASGDPIPVGTIFNFNITGVAATVQVPAGTFGAPTCSPPIEVAAGQVTVIEEARTNTAVVDIDVQPTGRVIRKSLFQQVVTLDVPAGGVQDETVVTYTNRTARTGTLKICKEAADSDVSGYFNFIVQGVAEVFSVAVGTCSELIVVPIPDGSSTPFTANVTELAQPTYRCENVTTSPANALNSWTPDLGYYGDGSPILPNNLNGCYADVELNVAGGAANQTTVSFYNRSLPGRIRVCKKTADPTNIPVGTAFSFTISGQGWTSPTDSTPKPQTETFDVLAGPASQGGFCAFAPDRWRVGDPVFVGENGLNMATNTTTLELDKASKGGYAGFTAELVRLSSITSSTAFLTLPKSVNGNAAPFPATITGINPNIYGSKSAAGAPWANVGGTNYIGYSVIAARNSVATIAFTNFVYRPAILNLCKAAGPGIVTGTPFTFSIAPADPTTTWPYPTGAITVRAGSCNVVNGPFPEQSQFPGTGLFNFGTSIIVTEAAAPGTTLNDITSTTLAAVGSFPNYAGTLTKDLVNRWGTLTLNRVLGIPVPPQTPTNYYLNEMTFTNELVPPSPDLVAIKSNNLPAAEAWTRQFGSSSPDVGASVAVDTMGNIYIAGQTEGTLPGQTSSGDYDAFVRKYDAAGNELWTRQFGSNSYEEASDIAVDTAGNSYVVGFTYGTIPGQASSGYIDAFVRKYDTAGNEVWTRQFGTSAYDQASGIHVDSYGNSYIGGATGGTLPGQTSSGAGDAFVRKYDAAGNEVWTRQFGTSVNDSAEDIGVDASGNIYVSGSTKGTFPGQTYSGGWDTFLRKYDPAGNEVWTRQFGSSTDDIPKDLGVDAAGDGYVAGWTGGTLPGQTSSGSYDAFVRKYDQGGNEVWTRQFGSGSYDFAQAIAVDAAGNSYAAGVTGGTLPGQTSAGGDDAFVRKYDPAGSEVWTRQFGTNSGEGVFGGAVDADGNIYVTGNTSGALPGQTSSGVNDAFVRKFSGGADASCAGWTWTVTVVDQGSGDAAFAGSQRIVLDDLPSTGLAYGSPTLGNFSSVTGSANVTASITGNKLEVETTGPVTIGAGGSFTVSFTVTPTAGGTYVNPRSGGTAAVDPDGNVGESNETNNDFTDNVTVTACPTPSPDLVAIKSNNLPAAEAWTRQFGSNDTEEASGIAVDNAGNSYVAGVTQGALPGQTSSGGSDAFVRKYDTAGNEVWTRQFGSSTSDDAIAIGVDTAGNSYVAGWTGGTLPGQTSSGGTDAFVRKYDAAGNALWTRQFGSSSYDFAQAIAVDTAGNIYAAGYTQGTLPGQTSSGSYDAFVRKYDASGNIVWTRQFGSNSLDEAFGIAVDAAGNSYTVGITFGALPGQTSSGGFDAFVRKYDQGGNEVWTRQFGSGSYDFAQAIAVDAAGNSYAAGITGGTLPGQTSAGGDDAFVRKYDTAGNEVWTRQFGSSSGDVPNGIAVDAAGQSYVAGETDGALPGQTSTGGADGFVRKYDTAGNEVWTQQFGTSLSDVVQGIAVDAAGNSYTAGFTFGALPGQTSSGVNDAFVRKFSGGADASCAGWTWTVTVVDQGSGDAAFAGSQRIVLDDLPSTGLAYGSPTLGNFSSVTGSANVTASITGNKLEVETTGPVTIGAGGSFTVSFTVTPTAGGTYVNPRSGGTAAVDPDGNVGESNEANNTFTDNVTVTGCMADLSLTKTVDIATPPRGSNVTFTVTVTNSGPDQATGVTVNDLLPAGYTFVSSGATQGTYVDGTGIWTVGTLSNGGTATLQITATVNPTGPYANSAQVSGSDQGDPDSTPNNNDPMEDDQATSIPTPTTNGFPDTTFDDIRVSKIESSTTLLPPTDIKTKTAQILARNTTAQVTFTNFVFRPAVLKLCKVAGPGVAPGTPFTFNIAPADPLTTWPYTTTSVIVPAGSCTFVNGPFPPEAGYSAAANVGTFNYNTAIVVTEVAAGTAVTAITSTNTSGGLIADLAGRRATLTLDKALLIDLVPPFGVPDYNVNELSFTNVVSTIGPPPDKRPRFDFDGDHRSDVAVFRPSDGNWYYSPSSSGGARAVHFGSAGDIPMAADYDGDGTTDVAVFRPTDGNWYILGSTAGFQAIHFGATGDVPMAADFDGDGNADVAVFRPSDGNWYINGSAAGFSAIHFGITGDIPVAADFDGDSKADVAVFRPSDGTWYINGSTTGFTGVQFGTNGDIPVGADYDGDGKADTAVFRPSTGTWYKLGSSTGFSAVQFGTAGDTPVPADYDGDGKTDVGVYRGSDRTWYILNSSQLGNAVGGLTATYFGASGDVLMRY